MKDGGDVEMNPLPGNSARRRRRAFAAGLSVTAVAVALSAPLSEAGPGKPRSPLPTTPADYFQTGTQPQAHNPDFFQPLSVNQCVVCHGNYDPDVEPWFGWTSSMLAQSARDPVFWAAVTIANQDAVGAGEYCIRCHAPNAFLSGRAADADNHNFDVEDFQGVSCTFCHRVVDPVFKEGTSPASDEPILDALAAEGLVPTQGSNARYVVDPDGNRRGSIESWPFNPHFNPIDSQMIHSPFHSTSEFCWTCHDVSNPLLMLQPDGSYDLAPLGEGHPTDDQNDQLPIHRTFSEWMNSYYASIGVDHDGRFGGNHPTGIMKSCQDCHMPDAAGISCNLGAPFQVRPDVPNHTWLGANTWVIRAVRALFPDSETFLSAESVENSVARNLEMLQKASDLELQQDGSDLRVRVINRSGHKLPTGFPDGRRVWVNVRFLDLDGKIVEEYGAYDFETATLADGGADTKVYQIVLGLDEEQSAITGLPAGPTKHFVLANEILFDNRIPPAGFSNAIAATNQTGHVGAFYANGQHWDDTWFPIPDGATKAAATVYYQTTSREFIEFLRDTNVTDGRGQEIYDLWADPAIGNKSQPAVMDSQILELAGPGAPADFDEDGVVGFGDLLLLLSAWEQDCPGGSVPCPPDLDGDGTIGFGDLLILLSLWGLPA